MNYELGVMYFSNIFNNVATEEEINKLNEYIEYLISKMSDETISYDEQELLDTYINYLRDNIKYIELVNKYDKVVYIKNDLRLDEEEIAKEKGEIKVLALNNKKSGIVLTSVILEVVITLGLIIGIFILALS